MLRWSSSPCPLFSSSPSQTRSYRTLYSAILAPTIQNQSRVEKFLSNWLRRGHLCNVVDPPSMKATSTKPAGSLWRWMTARGFQGTAGLVHRTHNPLTEPYDATSDPHSENQSPIQGESSPLPLESHNTCQSTVLRNPFFLEEGHIGGRTIEGPLHILCGRPHRAKRCSLPNEMCNMSGDGDRLPRTPMVSLAPGVMCSSPSSTTHVQSSCS